ncbi:MAG: prepilin-type N-terminal cleavage/methylation domain-containing protein [Candidatus Omnitrophica bacterium]|nr:prepilin-type N-terminal cleavage/methylation domain-containing protein [Candidatus Omnitrophota bacterium]
MRRQGFTLIELLIVVAIIGILAAIAVPNFLNAQIRAKCSRAISDMKTIETSLEMYRLDNNDYPPADKALAPGSGDYFHPNEIRYYRLTTPVSYLNSIPKDPFATNLQNDFAQWGWAYDYVNNYGGNHSGGWGHIWRLSSWGPDGVNGWGGQRDGGCPNGIPDFVYQTSNGLISKGDIVWVGAKDSQSTVFCNIQNGI